MKKRIMAGIMAAMMVLTMMRPPHLRDRKKQWNHLLKQCVECLMIHQI